MQQSTEPSQEPSQASQSQPDLVSPSLRWNRVAWQTLRLTLLALTVIALWLTIENRWGSNFSLPTRYSGDAPYVLGMMRLAQRGDLGLFTHIYTDSLGAPFIGQLNDFPQTERVIIWLGGQIARFTGLIPSANIMLMLSCIVAAFSFYSTARLWKISRLLAWVFAIAYAFLPHNQRSLHNLGIIFTGLLPLQFYVLWYIATVQKLSWRSSRFRLTLAIALLSGMLNIYWVFFFVQLYIIALLYRALKQREFPIKAAIPLVGTCLAAASFLGSFIIHKMSFGKNPAALVRSYYDIEKWALKPIDLFLPGPGSSWSIVSSYLSRYYEGGKIDIGETWWTSYIGLFSILGLLVLFLRGTYRQINKHSPSLPYLVALWIIAYASFGGLHSIVSLMLDFYDIRCTNRYSIAIGTVGFLYFVFVIYRTTRHWSFLPKCISLVALVLFFVADQSYRSYKFAYSLSRTEYFRKVITEDRSLVFSLESSLESGSTIYILPVVDFPEPFLGRGAVKSWELLYNSMRPFLYSTKLRYSYGSHKGRQGADWQLDVQDLPAGEMALALESYGFAGILLNRSDYEDRGEQLLSELAEAGWPMEFEQGRDNEWVFIRLSPAEDPILPTLTPYTVTDAGE